MRLPALAAVVVVFNGCGLIGPTNSLDPDAPLETQARAAISVSVVDVDGALLVDGVTVDIEGAAADFVAGLDDDVFKAVDLVPGAYAVVVRHPSFVPATRDVELTAGVTRVLQVALSPLTDATATGGTVSGTARKEGQLIEETPDHSGIVVEVLIEGASTGVRTLTNGSGRYDLTLLAGSYSLLFTAPDHEEQILSDVVVAVGGALELDPLTLTVNPGSIDGTVLLEDLDPADGLTPSPAAVTISLVGGTATTTAAADGTFLLTGLPPGTQALRFALTDHTAVEVPVVVHAGATATLAAVTLVRDRGVIFGVVDVTGAPDVSGVLVEAEGAGVADVTGVDGSFSLTVPTGTYDVTASKLGARRARADAVVVVAGAVVDAGVLTLAPNIGVLVINDGAALTNDPEVTLVLDESDAVSVRASEDPTFIDDEFVEYPLDGRVAFSLSDGDGDKTIFVQVRDDAGDVRQLQGDIALDTTAPALESVVVDDGDGLTTSLSITVSVLGTGADEMAVATDGTIDSELFQPFAPTSIALLPSDDGDKTVCVELRDSADNRAGPVCVTVTLETAVPVAPRMLINGENVDSITVTAVDAAALRVVFVPFGGPNSDVAQLEGSIESPDPDVGGVGVAVNVPCVAEGGLVVCDDDDGVPGILLDLFTTVAPGDVVRPNLVLFRARDEAGNLSGEATLLVVIDEKLPSAPTPTNASCAAGPGPSCAGNLYLARTVNSDSFTLRLREQAFQIDRTFTEYRVAQTIADDVTPSPLAFEPTASVDNIVFALVQGAPLNGSPVTATCNPLSCLNHLFIVAVDAAGNQGPTVRIDLVEDSSPPTRPQLAPQGGRQRGNTALLRLAEPARDRSGVDDDGDAVRAYEIKEGIDGSFEGVPDGQPTAGPWELRLKESAGNEVCVRGVDSAGNVGIEDCIDVEEATIRHPVRTEQADGKVALAGDLMVSGFDDAVFLHRLSAPDLTDSGDRIVLADVDAGRFLSAHRLNHATGLDVVDLLLDADDGPDQMQVFLGLILPPPGTRRSICGRGGDTDGFSFAFKRGADIVVATRAEVSAVVPEADPAGCANVGTAIATLSGGLCAGTAVRVDGNVVVWCEGAGIIKRSIGRAAAVTLSGAGGAERAGLLFGNADDFQQPLVTSTATFFNSGATLRRVPHTSTVAVDTGITTARLEDAEGDRVAYIDVDSEGAGFDVFVVDLSRSPVAQVRITNDFAPESNVTLDGDRVAFVDFGSLNDDIGVADLATARWLVASPATEFQPCVGTDLVAWVGFDDGIAVFVQTTLGNAVVEGVVARLDIADAAAAPFSFIGGGVLGPAPVSVAGRNVLLLKRDAINFTLRAVDVDAVPPTPIVLSSDLKPIDNTRDDATAAYATSPDGAALVFVDSAGAVRFGRLPTSSPLSTTTLATIVGTVPSIDTELVGNVGNTVLQVGNAGGDPRTAGSGALSCIGHDAAGAVVTPAATIRRGGVDMSTQRAPALAAVGADLYLAYQDGGATRTHVCELDCAVVPPVCFNDVVLGVVGDRAPRISRTGLVVWVTFARSAFGDVAVYDIVTDRVTLLTGVDGEEAPRADVDVNDDRVVWADGRLGDFDIWESRAP